MTLLENESYASRYRTFFLVEADADGALTSVECILISFQRAKTQARSSLFFMQKKGFVDGDSMNGGK